MTTPTPPEPADAGCVDETDAVLAADETGDDDEPQYKDVPADGTS